jgi:hypothetical protein
MAVEWAVTVKATLPESGDPCGYPELSSALVSALNALGPRFGPIGRVANDGVWFSLPLVVGAAEEGTAWFAALDAVADELPVAGLPAYDLAIDPTKTFPLA